MGKKEEEKIDFDEALRRIANAPKHVVPDKKLKSSKGLGYNKDHGVADKPPRPAKRRS